jgi:glycine/D-amino acid oxidase-like deaminating enzyme
MGRTSGPSGGAQTAGSAGRALGRTPDVAIVGGGIVGCAAAAFLAEAGARVQLFERGALAGAASGRNSGSIQHPFDPVLAELHVETLRQYRELEGFDMPEQPAGVLLLARQRAPLVPTVAQIAAGQPELEPALLDPHELKKLEPGLGRKIWACRLETGYPVQPAAATLGFAERARRAGAQLHEGRPAWPWVMGRSVRGVLAGGRHYAAGAVLVAAGPWAPEVIDPTRAWRPIVPVWGVVLDVTVEDPPRHVVEELGVEGVAGVGSSEQSSAPPVSIFSLVAANGAVSVGSTFLAEEPDAASWAGRLRRAGEPFVPALARARVESARACARPQSLDGRPLVGPAGGIDNLWIAAGHGPWGISTGPATARLAADALLGRAQPRVELLASRFG